MSNDIGTALRSALGGLVGGRVYPVLLSDRPVYPCIAYVIAGSLPDNTVCGPTTVTVWRYRIDVYAETPKEAGQIAASVKSIMRGFAFPNTHQMEIEGYEPEVECIRRTLDFNVTETSDNTVAADRAARVAASP